MTASNRLKILFIINPGSGNHSIDWEKEIKNYFESLDHALEFYILEKNCNIDEIKTKITNFRPDRVVAVGGDGTVNLAAECVLQKNIPLAILPAGSANGMAKELGISELPREAMQNIISGVVKKIHVILINGKLCIHLSDVGYNARMIEEFQTEDRRGIFGYLKATLKVAKQVLFVDPTMQVLLNINGEILKLKAAMIVLANAKKYGSGAVINPLGNLEDEVFEVVVIKKTSLVEIFKMMVTHSAFNPQKTEIFQTDSLSLNLTKKNHFQIDGEYLGKITELEAHLIPAALEILVPSTF